MNPKYTITPGGPHICIPLCRANVSYSNIKNVFHTYIGEKCISDIVTHSVKSRGAVNYKRVYIYFKKWPDNDNANYLYNKLINNEAVNIVYNEPLFWKCSILRDTK